MGLCLLIRLEIRSSGLTYPGSSESGDPTPWRGSNEPDPRGFVKVGLWLFILFIPKISF